MNTLLHCIMNKWESYAEEVQGYLGLFLSPGAVRRLTISENGHSTPDLSGEAANRRSRAATVFRMPG